MNPKPRLFLLLLVLVAPLKAAAQEPADRAAPLLRQARADYRAARFDEAQAHLVEAIAICERGTCPGSLEARLFIGLGSVAHRVSGDLLRARMAFDRGLTLDPDATLDPAMSSPDARAIFDEVAGYRRESPPAPEADVPEDDEAPEPREVPPTREPPAAPRRWAGHVFVEAGYSLTAASAGRGMEAASRPNGIGVGVDPQLDAVPENDSYDLSGTNGCGAPANEYCVRVTDGGLAFAHGFHLVLGAFVTDRVGVAARVRIAPSAGSGPLSHLVLGARFYYRAVLAEGTGFGLSAFFGPMFGQIQVRPKQELTPGANRIERPFIRTGPVGVELGAALAYTLSRRFGLFASPELYVLAPRFSLGLQLTAGVTVRIGGSVE